jgi:purine-binding chemotaxis protein CheW
MRELAGTMDKVVKAIVDKEGKYLTSSMADEEYGIGMMPITSVPQTPEFVKGVINLRGKVIPVVDLRLRFGMESIDYSELLIKKKKKVIEYMLFGMVAGF